MKTMEELFKEVLANDKLKEEAVKAIKADKLADFLKRYNKAVAVCESIRDGVSLALDRSDDESVVCAVGSLYSVGEIRACFEKY